MTSACCSIIERRPICDRRRSAPWSAFDVVIWLAVFALTSFVPSPAFAKAPSQWPAFRLNRELDPVFSLDGNDAFAWQYKTGGGISSSPTVVGDTLYVTSNDHRLYAFDLRSGRLKWSFLADNELMAAPLVWNGVVVIGEGDSYALDYDPPHYSLLGKGPNAIRGIDAATGKPKWSRAVPGSAMPTGAIVDGAYVEHDAAGLVFSFGVGAGKYRWRSYASSIAAMAAANNFRGSEIATAGDYPNAVMAIDATDGRIVWRTAFPADASAFADCPVASDGDAIYGMYLARPSDSAFGFVGYTTPGIEHAYKLDGGDGKVVWDVPLVRGILPINNHATIPLVYGRTMYLGSAIAPQVFALDVRTGKQLWALHVAGPVKGGMVGVDGKVYFGDLGGYLWAVDARSGAVVGKKKMPDGFNVGSPIVAGKTLIIGSAKGYVFAVPLATIAGSHDG